MKRWTEKEIATLTSVYPIGGFNAVMKKINRSELSIRLKAQHLGITVAKENIRDNQRKGMAHINRHGENNGNWKGGIAENNYHYKKLQVKRYPERVRARELLGRAVKQGEIEREPCGVCGNPKSEAHHRDYSKPLEVVWLCRKHHIEQHKKESC